jgi:hypothetical protein
MRAALPILTVPFSFSCFPYRRSRSLIGRDRRLANDEARPIATRWKVNRRLPLRGKGGSVASGEHEGSRTPPPSPHVKRRRSAGGSAIAPAGQAPISPPPVRRQCLTHGSRSADPPPSDSPLEGGRVIRAPGLAARSAVARAGPVAGSRGHPCPAGGSFARGIRAARDAIPSFSEQKLTAVNRRCRPKHGRRSEHRFRRPRKLGRPRITRPAIGGGGSSAAAAKVSK